MTTSLAISGIAILVANGFEESHITTVQKTLTKHKIPYKIVAPEQGLVNGWQNAGWGHCFTVDEQLNTALGSDFDALVIVGGMRGVEKLKTNPHTRRIVNHCLEAKKPVAAFGEAVSLLALSSKSAGLVVSSAPEQAAELQAAGLTVSQDAQTLSGVVVTAVGDVGAWIDSFVDVLKDVVAVVDSQEQDAEQAAA